MYPLCSQDGILRVGRTQPTRRSVVALEAYHTAYLHRPLAQVAAVCCSSQHVMYSFVSVKIETSRRGSKTHPIACRARTIATGPASAQRPTNQISRTRETLAAWDRFAAFLTRHPSALVCESFYATGNIYPTRRLPLLSFWS